MRLDPDGAQLFPAAVGEEDLAGLLSLLGDPAAGGRPGVRLDRIPDLPLFLGAPNVLARGLLGPATRPVGAVFFDKSSRRNWALGWHQDRVIPVRERIDVPGFTAWTVKSGIHYVAPPFAMLARMLTLRLHLDGVGEGNAPLLVAPGSHRLGQVAEGETEAQVARLGSVPCLAAPGDIWAYATPILHASARARRPTRRRVLQLLYSADDLPGGLEWLGVRPPRPSNLKLPAR